MGMPSVFWKSRKAARVCAPSAPSALRDFQKTEGMPITGELTEQTKMMLGIGATNAAARPFSRADAPQPGRPAGALPPVR